MGALLPNSARRRDISSPCISSISLLLTMATDRCGAPVLGGPDGTRASAVLVVPGAAAAAGGGGPGNSIAAGLAVVLGREQPLQQ